MSRSRGLRNLVVVLVAAAGLAGCGSGDGERLSIATGGSGGVYFVYGGGLAEQIGEHLDGYQATAEVTSASVDNMYLIADGRATWPSPWPTRPPTPSGAPTPSTASGSRPWPACTTTSPRWRR